MSGIRDHVIATIKYKYRAQYRVENEYGDHQIRTEQGITKAEYIGLFPSEAIAFVWASRKIEFLKESEIVEITSRRPDVAIIEHTW